MVRKWRAHENTKLSAEERYRRGQLAWTLFVAVVMIGVAIHSLLSPKGVLLQSSPSYRADAAANSPSPGAGSEERRPAFQLYR